MATKLQAQGVRVVFCEANERVVTKLEKADVIGQEGTATHAGDLAAAVKVATAGPADAIAPPLPQISP